MKVTTSQNQNQLHAQQQVQEKAVKRLSQRVTGPSIKDALAGKFKEENISAKEQHEIYTKADEKEDFSQEDLAKKWNQFLVRLDERPNLKSTLSRIPEIKGKLPAVS